MASAVNCKAYEGYSKLQTRCTGPYQVISVEPRYAKTDQDVIKTNVSIDELTRVAKEGRSNMEVTSYSGTDTDTDTVHKASIEKEKNFYAADKIVVHKK